MVTRLYVDNFRCLINFELRLDETNVLLGPNGSGKTSVLEVLRRIQALVARGARIGEVFPASDLSLTQVGGDQHFELDLQTDGGSYHYLLRIQHDRGRRRMRIALETLEHDGNPIFEFNGGTAQLYHDDYAKGPEYPFDWTRSGIGALNERPDNRKLTRFRQAIADFVVASPCPPLFEPETRSEDEFLEPFMQNFVGWYRHAAQENMRAIAGLFEALGEALPGFDSISLTESGENTRALKVAFRGAADDGRPDVYGFGQLSDGQRALLALYCLVFLSSKRASLFLDEPDNYLALREIQPWLAAVGEHCGDTLEQAIVVSHHPVTIDYLAGAKGRWFYRDGTGPVRVSDQPDRTVDGISLSETTRRSSALLAGRRAGSTASFDSELRAVRGRRAYPSPKTHRLRGLGTCSEVAKSRESRHPEPGADTVPHGVLAFDLQDLSLAEEPRVSPVGQRERIRRQFADVGLELTPRDVGQVDALPNLQTAGAPQILQRGRDALGDCSGDRSPRPLVQRSRDALRCRFAGQQSQHDHAPRGSYRRAHDSPSCPPPATGGVTG